MVPKIDSVGDNYFMCLPFLICCGDFFRKFINFISLKCGFKNPFSIGFNVGTFHRLLGLGGFFYLLVADFWTNDPKEFGNGAVRSGGGLTASSSWGPLYSVENAILTEQIINPNPNLNRSYSNPNFQSSWCAANNEPNEWICVSLPKSEHWQGFKISGNPILGAYVTDLYVEVGKEDSSEAHMMETDVESDEFTGEQNATTIVTYRLSEANILRPFRHLCINPTEWVGPRPCLKFEAFYY